MPLTHRGREILRRVPGGHLRGAPAVGCEIVRHEELCVGCGTCAIGAYFQEEMDAVLGVDGHDEFTLYLAPVGKVKED